MKQDRTTMPQIALVTRTNTINQGNQALSSAWRDYLALRYPEARVRLYERAPGYLRRHTISALSAQRDPVAAFDRIAESLLTRMPANPGRDPSVWEVTIDSSRKHLIQFRGLRHALQIRRRLAALNFGASDYLNRLYHLTQANIVVVNPAGEFQPSSSDTALVYLLEARCAQIANCRTAFVNLSFEATDPMVALLSDYVFSSCDIVEFRDDESRERFHAKGGRTGVSVLPDGVLISGIDRKESQGAHGIAIVINGPQTTELCLTRAICKLLERLVENEKVTLTSNEFATDRPYWNDYLAINGINCVDNSLDFRDYALLLANFEVVVSSRLHTCVMALLAGVPVVPLEAGKFKLTGFFNKIGMPNEPVRAGASGWEDSLLNRIRTFQRNREERIADQNKCIEKAQLELIEGLNQIFTAELLKF